MCQSLKLSLSWEGTHKSLADSSQSQSQKVKRNCNPGLRAAIQCDIWKKATLRGEKNEHSRKKDNAVLRIAGIVFYFQRTEVKLQTRGGRHKVGRKGPEPFTPGTSLAANSNTVL